MPIADDPGRTAGRVLLDGFGAELARFVEAERDGRRVADLFILADGVGPERAVPVLIADLSGMRVATEEPFGRLLVAAGGRAKRHGHVMSRDLVRDPAPPGWLEPPLPAGVRLTAVDRPAIDLAPACRAAYPREHPDFDDIPTPDRPEVELDEIMSGRLMGPLLRCSGLALGEDGAVLGAVLVNDTPREPPTGGPWISQIFRHPGARGVGGPLLRRALARWPPRRRAGRHARQHGARRLRGARLRRGAELAHRRAVKARGSRSRGASNPVMDHRSTHTSQAISC